MKLESDIPDIKKIALVAHDQRKKDLIDWCGKKKSILASHDLYATGTTGKLLEEALSIKIHKFISGPLGGDLQIGSSIVNNEINILIFFWDPLESMAHDPDIKALLRIATMWNIPLACNETTADFILSSPYFNGSYQRNLDHIQGYLDRDITVDS